MPLETAVLASGEPRFDWTEEAITHLFTQPLTTLIHWAQTIQHKNFNPSEIQLCTLLSIKTGGCKEDCSYCPQSAHYKTEVESHDVLDVETVRAQARAAKEQGSTRFCMGAAWRSPPTRGTQFARVLEAIRCVKEEGLEVCVTLGMLTEEQAFQLKEAGVYAYNHNLDTSPEYYEKIITTRTYADRLATLANVRKAGMTVCCGGIVGLGEARADRIGLLQQLANLNPHPESVPVNLLVRVEGTPLQSVDDLDIFELVRTIATARIIMPKSRVRLSAGRTEMSPEAQALCYLAGANSIFSGDTLLTTPNPEVSVDAQLLEKLGMKALKESSAPCH